MRAARRRPPPRGERRRRRAAASVTVIFTRFVAPNGHEVRTGIATTRSGRRAFRTTGARELAPSLWAALAMHAAAVLSAVARPSWPRNVTVETVVKLDDGRSIRAVADGVTVEVEMTGSGREAVFESGTPLIAVHTLTGLLLDIGADKGWPSSWSDEP